MTPRKDKLSKTMQLQQAIAWRTWAGRACMFFCLLATFAVLDGVVAKFFEPTNVFHVLPGEAAPANGPLPENIRRIEELSFTSDAADLTVVLDTIHSGYFLGGNMWRGRLLVGAAVAPGKYTVSIRPRDYPPEKPGYQIRVIVYPDPRSQRSAYFSLIKRHTGHSPYLLALACLPLIGLMFGAVFLLSRRIDTLAAAIGMAEIYHVARQEGLYRLTFGMGQKHGIRVGDKVTILDPTGKYVGAARVEAATENDATAAAAIDQNIRAGYFIRKT